MRICNRFYPVVLACGVVFTPAAMAQMPMPQGQFVCQVVEPDGERRFIGVQADSLERARLVVTGEAGPAYAAKVPAGRVLEECIDPRSQRFSSKGAQAEYEDLEL